MEPASPQQSKEGDSSEYLAKAASPAPGQQGSGFGEVGSSKELCYL